MLFFGVVFGIGFILEVVRELGFFLGIVVVVLFIDVYVGGLGNFFFCFSIGFLGSFIYRLLLRI